MSVGTRSRAGGPLREGRDPIAPREELGVLYEEIRRSALSGVRRYHAISGPRMTGKTTLVWSLRERLAAEGIPLVYVGLASQRGMDLEGFFRFLATEMLDQWFVPIDKKTAPGAAPGERFDPSGFMNFLRWLSNATQDRRRAVVALDDVGAVERTEVANPFFSTFRGLLNDHQERYWRYLFVFVGSLDLYELPNGALSPLLNVCTDLRVGNLDLDAVREIAKSLPDGEVLAEPIARITGGHPYLTQRVCQVLESRQAAGPEALDGAVEEILGGGAGKVSDPYIGHVLRHLDKDDSLRRWVKNLAEAEAPVPFSGPHDPNMYRPSLLGIMTRSSEGNCKFANAIVERAIQQYFHSGGAPKIDRFPIRSTIYTGPHSRLFKAWHPDLDIPLAIKTLPEDQFGSETEVHRFQREARIMMEFRHPSICPVYDFGRHGREYYIVMKFIHGGTFQSFVSGETTVVPVGDKSASRRARPIELLIRIADAIHHAHERGVIHRDLKPSNVMVDMTREGPVPLVIDFGLAKNVVGGDSTATSSHDVLLGTPAYLSPELASGDQRAVGVASDVYQLGGILYQILTGQPPHAGSSLGAVIKSVLRSEVLPPSHRNADVDPRLEAICMKAMMRDPTARFPSAGEFRDALAEALEAIAATEGGLHG